MLKIHNHVSWFIFKYMIINFIAAFPNFIYPPTFLVEYFTPFSLQTSNTSHIHMHSQLMVLLPISVKWIKKSEKTVDSCHHIYPPTSICTHAALSIFLSITSPSHHSSPTQRHHPSSSCPLSYIIHLLHFSKLDHSYHDIILPSYNPSLDFSCPPQLVPHFSSEQLPYLFLTTLFQMSPL